MMAPHIQKQLNDEDCDLIDGLIDPLTVGVRRL